MSQHRRWRSAAASLAVLALILTPTAARADDGDGDSNRLDLGNLADFITPPGEFPGKTRPTGEWFVEFQSEPTASGGAKAEIQRDRTRFTAEAQAAQLPASVSHIYTRLFNGVTVKADGAQASRLSALGSVKDIYPVLAMRAPTAPPSPETAATKASLAMIGADKAQTELGLTGEGIKVGIIDSGIDYNHPDLGGTGDQDSTVFPTSRVAYGWDFIGDDYSPWPDENGEVSEPKPDADPMDCLGHGTHVAGTIGGEGRVLGVAPEASLGAYKVFTCDGATTMAIVLEAMEQSAADGMDVVNMSLGWSFQGSPNHPLSQAADRMVDTGVVLVVAAGNEGEYGTQTLGAPSVADKAISVASFDATSVSMPRADFTPAAGEQITSGYTVLSGAPVPTGFSGELAIFSDPLQCKLDPSLAGKIAFFSGNGGCDAQRRTQLAVESGAIGVVVHADFFWDTVESYEAPAVGILTPIGQQVLEAMKAGPVTLSVPGTFLDDPTPYTPGLASYFTSWGLASDLSLKPDLGAPGGNIFSTLPLSQGGTGVYSGTSMASPHVAGSVALMLQSNAGLTALDVRERLQNTATPAVYSFMPESGVLDAAHRQGAGLIHVDKAVTLQSRVSPAKLSTGQSADGPFMQKMTLTNTTDAPITWTTSHEDAVTSANAWDEGRLQDQPDFTQENTKVTFSAETVTVPAKGKATVNVTIVPSAETADTATYSGFLRFISDAGSIQVPFAGIKGDWSDAPTLLGDDSDYPPMQAVLFGCMEWVDRLCVDEELMIGEMEADDDIITYMPDMYPAVQYMLGTQPASVTVAILQADEDGQPMEDTEQVANVERDPWRSPYGNGSAWDGQWVDDATGELDVAGNGMYVLRLHVTNHDKPVRTATWTSPAFIWEGVETEPEPEPEPTRPSPKPTTPKPQPTEAPDVYNTPGLHDVNGRKWFTSCEPYSQTTRCRTMIWATQVSQVNGVFQQNNGWVFNNLTYLPKMKRAQWKANPLAVTGSWTSSEGRKWRTECDTALTGRGGCRSFISTKVIESTPKAGGGYTYKWVTKEVFNNMVRFKKN